ncbi:hypothetical protein IWQ60_011675, partial [Tieghemiomyces parasiticus]
MNLVMGEDVLVDRLAVRYDDVALVKVDSASSFGRNEFLIGTTIGIVVPSIPASNNGMCQNGQGGLMRLTPCLIPAAGNRGSVENLSVM